MELVLLEVGDREQAAALAHVHPVRITLIKQPLLQAQQSPLYPTFIWNRRPRQLLVACAPGIWVCDL